jgi:hypothetical protein
MYLKIGNNFTEWKLPNNCNVFSSERNRFLSEMRAMALPHKCEFRNHHMGQFLSLELWRREFEGYRKLMSSSGREKLDDYIAKVKVFITYGYFDKEMNI